ncbi:zinc finger protein [Macleaya cordata]|uniref:Zinc finger protein n=1 Tax=Macleaya cordata TaxID=56857 RepID=A0A200PU35_MACCD|nr:zinc finger protein [Macleaya cordata]
MSGNDCNNDTSEKVELEEPKIEDSGRKKRRRSLKSSVWSDFDLIKKNGTEKAKCKHCGMEYCHDSKRSGTSTLQRHIQKCLRLGTRDAGQLIISPMSWNGNMTASVEKLDQAVFREKLYPGTYGLEVENVRNRMDLLYREYSSCKSKELTSSTVANFGSLGEGNSTFDEDEIGEDLQFKLKGAVPVPSLYCHHCDISRVRRFRIS